MQVNMHEAKSQLSKLGEKAWQGEEVVIAKAGKPYLNLIPHQADVKNRVPGQLKGQIQMSDDCWQSSEEVELLFNGEEE